MRTAFHRLAVVLSFTFLLAACKGTVTGPGDGQCPASFPDGQSCSSAGAECQYVASDCTLTFECDGQNWSAQPVGCATDCMAGFEGDACLTVGETCGQGDECSYEGWSCGADHTWSVSYEDIGECCNDCECVANECPGSPPSEGDGCDPCWDASQCFYEAFTSCGPASITATCDGDYAWHVSDLPDCACSAHTTPEDCDADPECRYLAGGCDSPSLAEGGCFPVADCSPDMPCPDGTMCTQLNANVCVSDPCIECFAVGLCL